MRRINVVAMHRGVRREAWHLFLRSDFTGPSVRIGRWSELPSPAVVEAECIRMARELGFLPRDGA